MPMYGTRRLLAVLTIGWAHTHLGSRRVVHDELDLRLRGPVQLSLRRRVILSSRRPSTVMRTEGVRMNWRVSLIGNTMMLPVRRLLVLDGRRT